MVIGNHKCIGRIPTIVSEKEVAPLTKVAIQALTPIKNSIHIIQLNLFIIPSTSKHKQRCGYMTFKDEIKQLTILKIRQNRFYFYHITILWATITIFDITLHINIKPIETVVVFYLLLDFLFFITF
jgi:hypothetical protein